MLLKSHHFLGLVLIALLLGVEMVHAEEPDVLVGPGGTKSYTAAEFKPGVEAARSDTARIFVQTLSDHEVQDRIKEHYNLSDKTYEEMFALTMGILAAETKNGESPKYWVKERLPWLVKSFKDFRDSDSFDSGDRWTSKNAKLDILWKIGDAWHDYRHADEQDRAQLNSKLILGLLHETADKTVDAYDGEALLPVLFDVEMNSRGPTQIKFLPEKLQAAFPYVEKSNLKDSVNAAIATMAYLAEALPRLKYLAEKSGFQIPEGREVDHLIYLYKGMTREITGATATIEDNIYYKQVARAREAYYFATYSESQVKEAQKSIKSRYKSHSVLDD